MKFPNQFNFRERFVISVIVIGVGVGVFLFYLISTQKIDESEDEAEVRTPDERREAVLESPGRSTVQSSQPPSQADIEKAIAALESLDATENRDESVESAGDAVSPETQVTDSRDQTPLSYEEELRQRFVRIKETAEYKEVNGKFNELVIEAYGISGLETPARDALREFNKNPYAILGYTEAEGDTRKLSDEEFEIMRFEGTRLREEAEAERALRKRLNAENRRTSDELHQQRLALLGMTDEELRIAVDAYRRALESMEVSPNR